jgi:hypothetical protein
VRIRPFMPYERPRPPTGGDPNLRCLSHVNSGGLRLLDSADYGHDCGETSSPRAQPWRCL